MFLQFRKTRKRAGKFGDRPLWNVFWDFSKITNIYSGFSKLGETETPVQQIILRIWSYVACANQAEKLVLAAAIPLSRILRVVAVVEKSNWSFQFMYDSSIGIIE